MIKVHDCKKQKLFLVIRKLAQEFCLSKHKKVFIKPNLGGRYPIIRGENTSYDIVHELCGILKENGCQEIVIGHTSLLNFGNDKYDFETLIKQSGLDKLRKHGIVTLLNLDNAKRFSSAVTDISFGVPEIIKSHYYINLCSLKTHMETTVSLSLKNQMGLLSADERKRSHQINLDQHIAYLGSAVKPQLNIIDGRIGMQGNGPHHGTRGYANIIICGDDMVEADSMACSLIGVDFAGVKHIANAIKEGAGIPISQGQYKLYKELAVKFQQPQEYFQKYFLLQVWPNKACSGCIFSLSNAHKKIFRNPVKFTQFLHKLIKSRKFNIVLGKDAEKNISKYSGDVYAIGDCTNKFASLYEKHSFLPGCPPTEKSIAEFLLKK
ncbi:MAG: DUF362 domain-containing protein [Candidatus Omnitrophota bacterium]